MKKIYVPNQYGFRCSTFKNAVTRVIAVFLLFAFANNQQSFGQCTNNFLFPAATINAGTGAVVQIANNNREGDDSHLNGFQNATTYIVAINNPGDFITVHIGTRNGAVLASGITPLTFTTTSVSDLFIHYNCSAGCGTACSGTNRLTQIAAKPAITAIPASGCVGASIVLTGTNMSGVTLVTFNGSGTTAVPTAVTATSVTVTIPAAATSGTLTVTGGLGGTATSASSLTVNPFPVAAGAITGSATVCQGQNTVSYSVPAITNATSYTWAYSGSGATITGTGNTITINYSATATSGSLTVMGTNSCGNGTVSANFAVTVNPLPVTAGTITGSATVCQGQNTVSYTVPAITNATSYTWAYSGTGATITGTGNTVTISYSATATSGNLTVMGTNSCGNGTVSANFAITVNPLPVAAGTITGSATVCQGQNTVSYSVPAITNATSYTWAYSGSGATITGTGSTITIDFSATATSGSLTVKGTNSCGNGTVSANFAVTVNPLPVTAGAITGSATACQGQNTVSYSVPAITNATSYTWAYSGAELQ